MEDDSATQRLGPQGGIRRALTSDPATLLATLLALIPLIGGVAIGLDALALGLDVSTPRRAIGAEGLAVEGIDRSWWVIGAVASLWLVTPSLVRNKKHLKLHATLAVYSVIGLMGGLTAALGVVALLSRLPEFAARDEVIVAFSLLAALPASTWTAGSVIRASTPFKKLPAELRGQTSKRCVYILLGSPVERKRRILNGTELASAAAFVCAAGATVAIPPDIGGSFLFLLAQAFAAFYTGHRLNTNSAMAIETLNSASSDSRPTAVPQGVRALGLLLLALALVVVLLVFPLALGLGFATLLGTFALGIALSGRPRMSDEAAIRTLGVGVVLALAIGSQSVAPGLYEVEKPKTPSALTALFYSSKDARLFVVCPSKQEPAWGFGAPDDDLTLSSDHARLPRPAVSLMSLIGRGETWQPKWTSAIAKAYRIPQADATATCPEVKPAGGASSVPPKSPKGSRASPRRRTPS